LKLGTTNWWTKYIGSNFSLSYTVTRKVPHLVSWGTPFPDLRSRRV